jgi:TolC family type I secretion outer membrane protein
VSFNFVLEIVKSLEFRVARPAVAALALSAALVLPAGVSAETIEEAMAMAYATNPSLLAARKELARADEQVAMAVAAWRPQSSVTAGGGYIKDFSGEAQSQNPTSQFSTTDGPTAILNLQAQQPIYNFFNGPRISQAEQTVEAQRAQLQAVEQNVLLRAAAAYLDVVRYEALLRSAVDYERALESSLDATRRQFDLGTVRNSAVAEAQSQFAGATAQRIQLEGALSVARANYESIIGSAPQTLHMPAMPGDLPTSLPQALDGADNNPIFVAANHLERAAQQGVDFAAGQKLPQFLLQGQLNPQSGIVMGIMTMPLYSPLLDPQLRSAKVLVGQRRQEMEAQRRESRQTVVSAWQDLQSAQGRIGAVEAQVKSARIAAEGTGREYGFGLRTITELLTNQSQYFQAQANLLGAQQQMRLAAYQLLAATGRLTARDLGLNVETFDPERYYNRVRDRWWGTGPDLE